MKVGLTEAEIDLLQQLLIQPIKSQDGKVWVFGSRARGDNRKFSDIDILCEFPQSTILPAGFIAHITESLEDSNFPYKVDLVSRSEVAQSYKDQVERDKIAL